MRDLLRKKYLLPALILALINSGCVTTGDSPGRRSLLQTYSSAHGEGAKAVKKKATKELTLKQAYGYTKPYVPVLEYPTVQKIWIPDHTGADECLVTGHWVYIILKPPTWLQVDEEEKGIEVPTIIPFKGNNAQE